MTSSRSRLLWLGGLAIAAAAALVGFAIGRGQAKPSAEKPDEAEAAVTAKVTTAPARTLQMEEQVIAYGTVVAMPEDVRTVSVPFESRVRRVLVAPGQSVNPDTRLVEIEPSPDTALQLRDALSTRDSSVQELAGVQQRLDMKLATKSDLLTAEQALKLAESKLQNLEQRGIEPKQLPAKLSGLVSKIDVQEGQIVAAGSALVEVVPADRIQVRLGVEPANAKVLQAGQPVHLVSVQGDGDDVLGHVRTVTRRVDPTSRLVDVYVSLPGEGKAGLMLETYVRGRIVTGTKEALAVPRSSVLPDEDKQKLFTIRDGKAVLRDVKTGLQSDADIELVDSDIPPGEGVVIQGNYELENGMAVEVEEPASTTEPARGEPSVEPAAGSQPATQSAGSPASKPGAED